MPNINISIPVDIIIQIFGVDALTVIANDNGYQARTRVPDDRLPVNPDPTQPLDDALLWEDNPETREAFLGRIGLEVMLKTLASKELARREVQGQQTARDQFQAGIGAIVSTVVANGGITIS